MSKRTKTKKRLLKRLRYLEQRIFQLRLQLAKKLDDPLVQHYLNKEE